MQLLQGPLIRTKYLGPTTWRGPRITAVHKRDSEQTQRVTIHWNHALDGMENAKAAALALCRTWQHPEMEMVLVACGFDHDHYYFSASPEPISSPA